MELPQFTRLPRHIGVIPDGNRRWALRNGLPKQAGYDHGIDPGFELYELCRALHIPELTLYGFTVDNTKRPAMQRRAFQQACVESVRRIAERDAALLVVGDSDSPMFPLELRPYTKRTKFGAGSIRVNFLVNYGWNWDLGHSLTSRPSAGRARGEARILHSLGSRDISLIDLVIRWGGRRRLSGFLPAQSVYADFYTVDDLWPDFRPEHLFDALRWYGQQDVTRGG